MMTGVALPLRRGGRNGDARMPLPLIVVWTAAKALSR